MPTQRYVYESGSGNLCVQNTLVACSDHRDTIIRQRRDDGRGSLRYLAETWPERVWQQLSLEQVPMNGAP